VGAVPSAISLPVSALIHGTRSVCGSNIGDRPAINKMLHFAARHGIKARVETVPFASVNEALDRVRKNQARYRMVLSMRP
jgi:alcohol/geraniol dehydrogenase (NADP+)